MESESDDFLNKYFSDNPENEEEYLKVLNPEQKAAVIHKGKSLLILAGAGSGKTRVITTKIAYLIKHLHTDPFSILAVTFTKKAASEMRQRAISLEEKSAYAQIQTFHSWGAYFLRKYSKRAGFFPDFTVYDDDDEVTLLTNAVPGLSRKQAAFFTRKISLAKDYCLTPESEILATIDDSPEFPDIYLAYEKKLRATGNVDFGDLIMLPYLILRDNPEIRHEIHRRYKVIMVDEYQDSNVAQFKLLEMLSGVQENAGTYVCVVGDDDQSIYKFRGAEVQNILNFQKQFPGTDVIKLETNYRSTSEILACAGSVVKNNSSRLGKNLISARGKGKIPALIFLPNQDDETDFCADLITNTHKKGVPYSEWAILYRTNAQSLGFESTLLHKKIPYVIVGSLKFYEREEIKDAISCLKFIVNPKDEVSFQRIINKPVRGIGESSQKKIIAEASAVSILDALGKVTLQKKAQKGFTEFCETYNSLVNLLPFRIDPKTDSKDENSTQDKKLSAFVDEVIRLFGLEDFHRCQDEVSGSQKIANLQELINSAVLYEYSKKGLLDFLDHIELDRTLETDASGEESDCVTLITVHNTKGLEFPRVIITGMEHGVFPRENKTKEETEEERRLFYVGITRAQNELYFTSCSCRRLYGKTSYMEPSPFLNELDYSNVRVLGEKPSSFNSKSAASDDPIALEYKKGTSVYHDDYGHGVIVSARYSEEGDWVVKVNFETGTIKRFLPKYQKKSLLVEKE